MFYLELIVAIVVWVEDAKDLTVKVDVYVVAVFAALGQELPRVLFHLNVEELAEIGEPLDELGG